MSIPPFEIAALRGKFLSGKLSASELLDQVLTRIAEWDDPALWISRSSESAVRDRARALDAEAAGHC
jgi:Asp-tRNA(Asn)/Glu-tRNA(Gln) amidotransferase A subunit family amidase